MINILRITVWITNRMETLNINNTYVVMHVINSAKQHILQHDIHNSKVYAFIKGNDAKSFEASKIVLMERILQYDIVYQKTGKVNPDITKIINAIKILEYPL